MKNSWLEKSENRYNVSVAGLDLEELIAKFDAMRSQVTQLNYDCNGMEHQRKKIEELLTPPAKDLPDTPSVEEYLLWQARCIQWMRDRVKLLETLFVETQQKLVEKRGKWSR
jgi:hypothetical protein